MSSSWRIKERFLYILGYKVFLIVFATINLDKLNYLICTNTGSSSNTANFSSASSIQTGFYLRKEISSLPELPKNITCISNAIVVGLKRSYEVFDINTLVSNKILDVDKDQRMLCLEVSLMHLFVYLAYAISVV